MLKDGTPVPSVLWLPDWGPGRLPAGRIWALCVGAADANLLCRSISLLTLSSMDHWRLAAMGLG